MLPVFCTSSYSFFNVHFKQHPNWFGNMIVISNISKNKKEPLLSAVTLMRSLHVLFVSFLQIDSSDFTVDKPVNATPGYKEGSEACVSICFEPHRLGEVHGRLCLSSSTGGKYTFLLHGVCVPPKVQGPFIIRHGRSLNIPFKNVFQQTTTFSFQVKKGRLDG